jgi:hypothetical protein
MVFAEYDHIVQTLAADGTDQSLHVCVLPWAPRRRDDFLDLHSRQSQPKLFAIDLVTISKQEARGGLVRESFDDLLRGQCLLKIGILAKDKPLATARGTDPMSQKIINQPTPARSVPGSCLWSRARGAERRHSRPDRSARKPRTSSPGRAICSAAGTCK